MCIEWKVLCGVWVESVRWRVWREVCVNVMCGGKKKKIHVDVGWEGEGRETHNHYSTTLTISKLCSIDNKLICRQRRYKCIK